MTENFLPKYQSAVTRGTLRCEVRNKAIRATPEERVHHALQLDTANCERN